MRRAVAERTARRPVPQRQAAAPAVDRSLASTADALGTLLASLRSSGLEAASQPYDRMQHVLVQQRLWSRAQGRTDLDPQFAAIAANARAIQRILGAFSAAIEHLAEIDRIEPSGRPPAPAASSAVLAELLLERRTVSAARLAALDWSEEDRRRFLSSLVEAGVLERTGWGRSLGYRLAAPSRGAAVAAVGEAAAAMTSLLTLNFGTYLETSRFKQRAFADGYLSTDPMYGDTPGPLVRPRGMREAKGAASLYSFYGLQTATWQGSVVVGRSYMGEFDGWMSRVLSRAPTVAYLSGHHSNRLMWWVDSDKTNAHVYMSSENVGTLEFGIIEWPSQTKSHVVKVNAERLQDGCLLVIGGGCNIGAPAQSLHYQRFFANGARKPIVCGWWTTIDTPRATDPSINTAFFDHLAAYWRKSSYVPATGHRLKWLYEYDPMAIVGAWGAACATYLGHAGQPKLWTRARARGVDGRYYRFVLRNGKAEPIEDRLADPPD